MDTVITTFLEQLTASPAGRQHLLSISVDAEEGDEQGIFEQLADRVEDAELRALVLRHRDDEVRHAGLFRGCLTRLGLEKQPVPDELRIVRRIADAGDEPTPEVRTRQDVADRYALLHAIEERGVEQFPHIAEAFRPVDPETAEVYLRVTRDERRHVRYCERIGRQFSDSDDVWAESLDRAREQETAAFLATGLDNIAYCTARGWVT